MSAPTRLSMLCAMATAISIPQTRTATMRRWRAGSVASGVKREDIFITTKVWRTDLAHDSVLESVSRLLEELNTEYIDLLLIHWPNRDIPIEATLGAMEELRRAGDIRAIGVSNFTAHHLDDALKTGIDITNNQIEVHPTFNQKDCAISARRNASRSRRTRLWGMGPT
jgi:2,5-diketo-D-gluconate reductase B